MSDKERTSVTEGSSIRSDNRGGTASSASGGAHGDSRSGEGRGGGRPSGVAPASGDRGRGESSRGRESASRTR